MKLSRVGCVLILALSAVSCAPSSLTSLRADDDIRGWRADKAVAGSSIGDVQGSPEEDLVYGDDVLPPRTRLRNKRRRRKRIRPQRPLPLLDYDDTGEQYRPRLRPRLRPRPLFEQNNGEEQFPNAPVEERRPRPGGKRRKPPHHFQDVVDGDVADKPGPPFSDILGEEEEYTNHRRRPSVYPRKPDHFPEDLPPRAKPHRFLQDEHEQYPAVSLQDDNLKPAHRPRKGTRRHPSINLPEPQEDELHHNIEEQVTRRKPPNKFNPSDETLHDIKSDLDTNFEEPSKQMELTEGSRQETKQEAVQELLQQRRNDANDSNKLSSSEKPPQAPQEEQVHIIQEETRKPAQQTKAFLPRFDNNKPYVPRGEPMTEPPEPPADMKPIAVSLDELLKIKNITLDQVLKENETTQKPSRASQGPLRRLPSASEFFAKRKNMSANENRPVNQTTEEPRQASRPRETKRKYGESRISIKEVLPTTTTLQPDTTITTQHKPMSLSMQESPIIDPVNMSMEDELSSQDRELAKKILKNRISEANNGSKVHEFLQSNGIRLPPITEVILSNKSFQEVTEVYRMGQVFDAKLEVGDRPVYKKIPLNGDSGFATSKPRDEILDLLRTESGSARLARILATRNMTLAELIEHRERGASHQHISNIFPADNAPSTSPTLLAQEEPTSMSTENSSRQTTPQDEPQTYQDLISIVNPSIYSQGNFDDPRQERGYRVFDMQYPNDDPNHIKPFPSIHQSLDYDSPYRAIVATPLASTIRTFPLRIKDSAEGLIIVDNVGQVQEVDNNVVGTGYNTISIDHPQDDLPEEDYERSSNLLPTAVKSAIIASTAIFGLAMVVFLTIFVVCKWRQKRARTRFANEGINTRARSPILDDSMQQDVRHTKCSLSPVLMHPDTYVEPRRYYLWRTIRNTLRYK